jgi:hypothetical protein
MGSHHTFGGRVVFDPRHIPAEWIRLADLNNRADGKETDEYKWAYRACCTGDIPSDKCVKYQTTQRDKRGPLYADPECVQRAIETGKARAEMLPGAPHVRPRTGPPMPSVPDESIGRIVRALDRIADALEAIATQPRNDDHTPFGHLLHASTTGDE